MLAICSGISADVVVLIECGAKRMGALIERHGQRSVRDRPRNREVKVLRFVRD